MAAPVGEDRLDRIAEGVVRFRCSALAVFLLELAKPLAFVSSQMLLLSGPIAHLWVDPERFDRLVEDVSSRERWEALIQRIEERERSG
jgi:hypothetical protein